MQLTQYVTRILIVGILFRWGGIAPGTHSKKIATVDRAICDKCKYMPHYMRFIFFLIAIYLYTKMFAVYLKPPHATSVKEREHFILSCQFSWLSPIRDFLKFVETFTILHWLDEVESDRG